ncbi:MAG: hypothetical protein WBN11_09845 [Eudoraea sp.]|uniref:hypothetical protein n=1 Tax=Eudoraea sp. TaxID=1979955 RepID=UPI003C77C2E9
MNTKIIISRSIAAIILFTLFSCILERDFSMDTIINKGIMGIGFGVLYGIISWGLYKYKEKKGS